MPNVLTIVIGMDLLEFLQLFNTPLRMQNKLQLISIKVWLILDWIELFGFFDNFDFKYNIIIFFYLRFKNIFLIIKFYYNE